MFLKKLENGSGLETRDVVAIMVGILGAIGSVWGVVKSCDEDWWDIVFLAPMAAILGFMIGAGIISEILG